MLLLDKENLHHSYLIEGGEAKAKEILDILGNWGIVIKGNPDIFSKNYESFGIPDARELKQIQSEKGLSGKRFFILTLCNITLEAMQALLKVFEEPAAGNHFFVIVPDLRIIIPTLRSRFYIISESKEQGQLLKEAEMFYKLNKKSRLDFVKKFVARDNARERALDITDCLEAVFKNNKLPINYFEELWTVKKNLRGRGASVKMILEHLALVLD